MSKTESTEEFFEFCQKKNENYDDIKETCGRFESIIEHSLSRFYCEANSYFLPASKKETAPLLLLSENEEQTLKTLLILWIAAALIDKNLVESKFEKIDMNTFKDNSCKIIQEYANRIENISTFRLIFGNDFDALKSLRFDFQIYSKVFSFSDRVTITLPDYESLKTSDFRSFERSHGGMETKAKAIAEPLEGTENVKKEVSERQKILPRTNSASEMFSSKQRKLGLLKIHKSIRTENLLNIHSMQSAELGISKINQTNEKMFGRRNLSTDEELFDNIFFKGFGHFTVTVASLSIRKLHSLLRFIELIPHSSPLPKKQKMSETSTNNANSDENFGFVRMKFKENDRNLLLTAKSLMIYALEEANQDHGYIKNMKIRLGEMFERLERMMEMFLEKLDDNEGGKMKH